VWQAQRVSLYRLLRDDPLTGPTLITALDGWVDAGDAATTAAEHIAKEGEVVAEFHLDSILDYRARRPTLDILEGRMAEISWLSLNVRRVRTGQRDLLVLTGPEPDYRWQDFQRDVVELGLRLGVVESICLGAIPAMVPHTRPTPVLMTGANRTPTDADPPLPADFLRVPASAVNLVEMGFAERGIPSVGFWAHVPHYVAGDYVGGALALIERVSAHLGVPLPVGELIDEVQSERIRLNDVVSERPDAQAYLEKLEEVAPPTTIATGDELAAEVERFLRETTGEDRNPFDGP
jgi:PAC2 family